MNELEQRANVVRIATSWAGTPYHHAGRIKGKHGGVDCLTLLAEVFTEAGLIARPVIPHYPPDFMLHRDSERFLDGVMKYTHEVSVPQPGDIAVWKMGRVFSHGAIVIKWPHVVHAYWKRNCIFEDASKASWLLKINEDSNLKGTLRPIKFFSFWG